MARSRSLLATIVIVAAVAAAGVYWRATRTPAFVIERRPDRNVLLITIDTLRADVLSTLGSFLAEPQCGEEARAAFGEALRIRRAKLPAGHKNIVAMEKELAQCDAAVAAPVAP